MAKDSSLLRLPIAIGTADPLRMTAICVFEGEERDDLQMFL
jgi:hypothetical protein